MNIKLRDPSIIMKLSRLGSFHQSRLSFMRQLLRRVFTEKWHFNYRNWSLNSKGVGHIVYSVNTGKRTYSLVVFTHDIPPQERSDRVIATAWDLTFTLFNGVPNLKDIRRLEKQIPLQEAGRMSENELVLGRANRSVRLWELVDLWDGHEVHMIVVSRIVHCVNELNQGEKFVTHLLNVFLSRSKLIFWIRN